SSSPRLGHPPGLHSFPTRRSSDLEGGEVCARRDGSGVQRAEVLRLPLGGGRRGGVVGGLRHQNLRPALALEAMQNEWRRAAAPADRKSTRLNSSHVKISYAVFCLK